jgi:hypothetical protein
MNRPLNFDSRCPHFSVPPFLSESPIDALDFCGKAQLPQNSMQAKIFGVEAPETALNRVSVHVLDVVEDVIVGSRDRNQGGGVENGHLSHPSAMLRCDYEIIQDMESKNEFGQAIESIMNSHADIPLENKVPETRETTQLLNFSEITQIIVTQIQVYQIRQPYEAGRAIECRDCIARQIHAFQRW